MRPDSSKTRESTIEGREGEREKDEIETKKDQSLFG